MIYLSDLTGRPVVDEEGIRIGRVQDLLISLHDQRPQPQVSALVIKTGREVLSIPMTEVAVLVGPVVVLARPVKSLSRYTPQDVLWLARDVLDKEIIDTDGARVVRVNDLELARANGQFYLANVLIGGLALLRRLGLASLAQHFAARLGKTLTLGKIAWKHVELLPGSHPVRLRLFGGKMADLHAADMAEIISDLSRLESSKMLENLDVERLADTLEEVEPEFQASLVESLPDEKVAEVLEEMNPDEAADLLAELPEERSQDLLNLMEREEAEDVRKLLDYPEDTAGGMMNTDVVTLRPHLTAEQAIAFLRQTAQDAETIYYVYVTDEENHLLGVFSLQALVLAQPNTPITEIMHDRVISFGPFARQSEIAEAVAKYSLLAVPIVDDENRLLGIVTADDAIDQIIPPAWKKRLPRLYG